MPTLENLTKSDLQGLFTAKSLRRARSYIHMVRNPVRTGKTLTAQVRGSRMYEVEIDVESGGIHAQCSCPYDWGGYCKHIGALLLKWIQYSGEFSVQDAPSTSNAHPIEVIPVKAPPTFRPNHLPFWLENPFVERLDTDDAELYQWLNEIKLQDLRQIAKRRGWKVKGTRKADIVRQISERITDPGDILKTVLALDKEHRAVLRAMVLLSASSVTSPDTLKDMANVWCKLDSYKNTSTYTHHLCQMGLALPGSVLDEYYDQDDFVPQSIARVLPLALEGVIPTSSHPQSNIGEIHLADPYPFVHAANQIILLLEQQPTPLRPPLPRPRMEKFYPELREWDYNPYELEQAESNRALHSSATTLTIPPPARSLPDETIERLTPVAGSERQLEFIYALLVAIGIFQPGSPVTIWTQIKEQFLRQGELAQRAILVQTFFRMLNWSTLWEMLRDEKLRLKRVFKHGNLKPKNLRTHLMSFRHVVLGALASLPDGEWVAIKDLFRLMRVVWPTFDSSAWRVHWRSFSAPSWFLVSNKSSQALRSEDANDWELAQGRFIQQIITGPLNWLGLADLCFDDDVLTAVRFHGLADLYWDRVEIPDAPPTVTAQAPSTPVKEAIVSDEHTISVAPSAVPPQAHNLLNKIARLETATAERFVYQLDPQTAHESFEAGLALSEIANDWEEFLAIPMPDSINAQLTTWWEAYGRVRIYENLTVIEFGDDYALTEMKAVTQLEQVLIAEISPRLVVIPQQALAALTKALEKAGYTPKQADKV